jgi:hypothetical protein
LRLWIETAHQSLTEAGGDVIRTFQTKEQFFAFVASGLGIGYWTLGTEPRAQEVTSLLEQGTPLGKVVETILVALPDAKREHVPFSILQVLPGDRAYLVECDAPPLFMTRKGDLVILPVVEEEAHGRLIRQCEFTLQDGDHLAMVSEGYIHIKGWNKSWGWRDIATSIRRLTETRCDAEQLLGALIRSYKRLAQGERGASSVEGGARSEERGVKSEDRSDLRLPTSERDVSILAMFVRPVRTVTVWSGPPAHRALEEAILEKLMDEPGTRIICGDTTADIAARLLGAELVMEPRPEDGWAQVPPTSQLKVPAYAEGVDLVTEGLVTLGKARERIAEAQRARDLPRKEDGATRLARALLTADEIHFLVGLAVNPAQVTETGVPLRRIVIEELMNDLKARGKIVSMEYF